MEPGTYKIKIDHIDPHCDRETLHDPLARDLHERAFLTTLGHLIGSIGAEDNIFRCIDYSPPPIYGSIDYVVACDEGNVYAEGQIEERIQQGITQGFPPQSPNLDVKITKQPGLDLPRP